jgi:4-azaleucine resistance transporter AzlC
MLNHYFFLRNATVITKPLENSWVDTQNECMLKMDLSTTEKSGSLQSNRNVYWNAILDIAPLAIAVVPWGILCGSLAVQTGLSAIQAQCMSLFVFAGAAQLSGLSIIGASGSLFSLLGSTSVISSRHLLYAATFREDVKDLPLVKRLAIAFVLTDEMFAVTENYRLKTHKFNAGYAFVSGLTFYLMWNISTLIGILAGQMISNLNELGLEFAIAATFIAMIIPSIKSMPTLLAVILSGFSSVLFHYLNVPNGLLISALIGMTAGFFVSTRGQING